MLEETVALVRIQTATDEVKKLLEELDARKLAGPHGIPNWVVKKCNKEIARKLSNLNNASLSPRKVPMEWKWARRK